MVYCGCVRKWVWFRFAVGYMFYSISIDTVLRCCPTQDHNFYLILRNTTHNNDITFILILLLYFHIIILIITVNELMIDNERIYYVYIYTCIYIKILKKCFICAQNPGQIT